MLEGYRRGAKMGVLDGAGWYSRVLEGYSRGHWTPLIPQLIDKLKVAEASLEDLQRNGTVRRFRQPLRCALPPQVARCAAPVAVCILATVCAAHVAVCIALVARPRLRVVRCACHGAWFATH